jgi:hypothetical protein
MKPRIKRHLFLTHRWLGIVLSLFVLLWFLTGIIMMYVEYPELTEPERLATLAPLDLVSVAVAPGEALRQSRLDGVANGLRLSALGRRPAYIMQGPDGQRDIIYADDGSRPGLDSPALALGTARHSGFATADSRPAYDGLVEYDQWTVSSALDEHRPLHRVRMGDAGGTVLYVSTQSGQIVRDTHRSERLWNWVGSTIHWIYPYQLRRHAGLWTNLLIYLSSAAVLAVLTGGIIGVLRLRPIRRYRGKNVSPYRGIAKWHHVLGIVCFVFITTFTFSGLMSMAPWGLFDSEHSLAEQVERYMGGPMDAAELGELAIPDNVGALREIEWHQVGNQVHALLSRSADDRTVLIESEFGDGARDLLRQRIESAVPDLLPGSRLSAASLLTGHDNYYYTRHNRYRPLPAYRVEFDDPEASWFDIDLTTGTVIQRHTRRSRVLRWLYNGLHSLDFALLTQRGALWDSTVIALCVFGSLFAGTAVVVAWRRLF